ncbi:MAG: hypothetical protein U0Y82_05590 [Thermoleophilia bacterium]
MIESQHPNRWFGSNPQAIPNHGRKLSPWHRELHKDWRAALDLDGHLAAEDAAAAEASSEAAAPEATQRSPY